MKLESLKRQLKFLEDNEIEVTKLVTDRHIQVSAYMANEKPEVEHAYDVWHVAKGITLYTFDMSVYYWFFRSPKLAGYSVTLGYLQKPVT